MTWANADSADLRRMIDKARAAHGAIMPIGAESFVENLGHEIGQTDGVSAFDNGEPSARLMLLNACQSGNVAGRSNHDCPAA